MSRLSPYLPRRRAAFRRAVALTIVVMLTVIVGWHSLVIPRADAASFPVAQREYLIKAAFIYDLLSATQWPKAKHGPLVLCVLGRDPFGAAWQSIAGRPVGSRKLAVTVLQPQSTFGGCDALFVGISERVRWPVIHATLAARPVLTISEMTGFTRDGGMVTLMNVENRLKFDVNLKAMRDAGLSISTDALEQADSVHAQAAAIMLR